MPVVLASQGPSDLDELGHHLLERSVQDAAWVLMFRQGTLDSERASRILGQRQVEDRTWSNDGRETVRLADRASVPARVLENLQPGTAWLRVPPVDRKRARVECVRVALPTPARLSLDQGTPSGTPEGTPVTSDGTPDSVVPRVSRLPESKAAALERVWEDLHGELGEGESVDHTCRAKMCHNPGHLEGVSAEENTRRRWEWAKRQERARAGDRAAAGGDDVDELGADASVAAGVHDESPGQE